MHHEDDTDGRLCLNASAHKSSSSPMNSSSHRRNSPTRKKSYLGPTKEMKVEKRARKSDVNDSLMKFLKDGNEGEEEVDFLSPSRKSESNRRSRLSKSNSSSRIPSERKSRQSRSRRLASEHGTPSTTRSETTLDISRGSDDAMSTEGSFAEDSIGYDDDNSLLMSPISVSSRKRGKRGIEYKGPRRAHSDRSSSRSTGRSLERTRSSSRHQLERRASTSSRPGLERRSSTSSRPGLERRSSASSRPGLERKHSISRRRRDGVRRSVSENASVDGSESLGSHLGALDRRAARRQSLRNGDDSSVHSNRSSRSGVSTRSNRSAISRSSRVDAGPLNAFLNSGNFAGNTTGSNSHILNASANEMHDEEFLKKRQAKQDAILELAKEEQSRYEPQRESSTRAFDSECGGDLADLDPDDDQPKMKKEKRGAFSKLKKGLSKTAKATKGAAKGSVNVVKDPKRAAKKVGGFAKDVGKETIKMALDPTLAAKTAVNLGKDGIVGTMKVTKSVGTGVTKGTLGVTKTVAKTGLKTTTMVVGGAGKVVHGATGLIFKGDRESEANDFEEYNAKDLASRRKTSFTLMDRVTGVIDPSSELSFQEEKHDGVKVGVPTPPKNSRAPLSSSASLLVPMSSLTVGGSKSSFEY